MRGFVTLVNGCVSLTPALRLISFSVSWNPNGKKPNPILLPVRKKVCLSHYMPVTNSLKKGNGGLKGMENHYAHPIFKNGVEEVS